MTPRLSAIGALALLLPVLAWTAVDDSDPPVVPPECPPVTDPVTTTTTTTTIDCTTTTTSVTPPTDPPTTVVETTAPTTTADGAETTITTITTTTIAEDSSTSTPVPTSTPADGATTTTVTTSPASATTTTIVADPATATVPEDLQSAPVGPQPAPETGRTLVAAGVSDTGQVRPITFPVAGPVRYGNDFGACRDGCRRQHKGNDLIGERLQPLLAMRDGVVDRVLDHPTAGYGIVVRDAEGWEYHVYHVNNDTPGTDDGADEGRWRFAPGVTPGASVRAGEVIAWMGDSGNSEGSVPHAHVEIHTPSGTAINPYWSLRLAQRDVNCAIVTVDASAAATPAFPHPSDAGWASPVAQLPGEWTALTITSGRPGAGATLARMWVGPGGFIPIDARALQAGDVRYDEDCARPTTMTPPVSVPTELGAILATIRAMETGGNYTTQITSSTASGAYAFLDSSWGGYGGYRRARDAPPAVQDAKAVELATSILAGNAGDVSTIPVSWYIGHVPIGAEWDTVPRPDAGNILTPREYQSRWMATYARILGAPEQWVATTSTWTAVDVGGWCRTAVVDAGGPGKPELALTLTRSFAADESGRVVIEAGDPCDPTRTAGPSEGGAEGATRPLATGPR